MMIVCDYNLNFDFLCQNTNVCWNSMSQGDTGQILVSFKLLNFVKEYWHIRGLIIFLVVIALKRDIPEASRSKIKWLRAKKQLWYNFSKCPKKFSIHPSILLVKNYSMELSTFWACFISSFIPTENKNYKMESPHFVKSSKKAWYSN